MTYTTAHCNARSLTHWARPGVQPTSSWILVDLFPLCHSRNSPGKILNREICSLIYSFLSIGAVETLFNFTKKTQKTKLCTACLSSWFQRINLRVRIFHQFSNIFPLLWFFLLGSYYSSIHSIARCAVPPSVLRGTLNLSVLSHLPVSALYLCRATMGTPRFFVFVFTATISDFENFNRIVIMENNLSSELIQCHHENYLNWEDSSY